MYAVKLEKKNPDMGKPEIEMRLHSGYFKGYLVERVEGIRNDDKRLDWRKGGRVQLRI